jgi:hypothetical protein
LKRINTYFTKNSNGGNKPQQKINLPSVPKLSQGKNFTIPTPEGVIRQQHRLCVYQPERGMQLEIRTGQGLDEKLDSDKIGRMG